MNSIKKRLVFQYLTIILLTIVVLEGLFLLAINNYYYGGVEQALISKATVSGNFINRYASGYSLTTKARYIFENIDKDELALVEVINPAGKVILDNSGFYNEKLVDSPDFNQALTGAPGVWKGNNEAGERILGVSTPIEQDNSVIGVLRYTTSLEEVDKTVLNIFIFVLSIGAAVLLLALLVSTLISRSIVRPIEELTKAAEEMTLGNFNVKISPPPYEDEIGKLSNTLNYMAKEIVKTDKMKNDFISSISHELRTPLTSIKGWSETILAGDLDDKEESREGLNIIIRETDRLVNLVEELLDFSKYQSMEIVLQRRNTNIEYLVKQVKEQLKIKAYAKDITISWENTAHNIIAYVDPNRFKQVLLNILDNAIKFTAPAGIIRITISNEDNYIKITIEDNGIGIREADLAKIKTRFYKADLKSAGSGLGLAIADEIITLHGGKLNIESSLDQGTRVRVLIPI